MISFFRLIYKHHQKVESLHSMEDLKHFFDFWKQSHLSFNVYVFSLNQKLSSISSHTVQSGGSDIISTGGASPWASGTKTWQNAGIVQHTNKWRSGSSLTSCDRGPQPQVDVETENLHFMASLSSSTGVAVFFEAAKSLRGTVLTGLVTGTLAEKW